MKKVLVTHYIKLQTIIHIRLKLCHQVVHQTNITILRKLASFLRGLKLMYKIKFHIQIQS